MLGRKNTDHFLMGTRAGFLQWVREGAGPAGVQRVSWLDNPFTFNERRDIGGLAGALPNGLAPGEVRSRPRRFGVILLAPSWREWHAIIGTDWSPWDGGVDCTIYDWNGQRLGTDTWPGYDSHIDPLDPRALAIAVKLLDLPPTATGLDKLRARYTSAPVE